MFLERYMLDVETSKVLKKTSYNKNTKEIADKIMKNEFHFLKGLETVKFKEGIDWNYQHKNSPNTYQLYLQSLDVVSHLCNNYEETQEIKYLKKAYDLIIDWIKYDKKSEQKNRFRWYDHTVASRSLNIVYFCSLSRDKVKINKKIIYQYLLKHGNFLFNDENYPQNNHGVMVDRGLISISLLLGNHKHSKMWLEKSLFRLRMAYYRDFSYKGTHLENSPDYHSMVRNLFNTTEDFLQKNGMTLGEDICKKLELTNKYMQIIIKPDSTIPLIGDTSLSRVSVKKNFAPFVDTEAGIAILQRKNKENLDKSTWISFISGYGSKTHKHLDDLSFNLFYMGKDIFVDSGKYNYVKNDEIRQYITSPLGHNTIAVKGMEYYITEPIKSNEKIRITDFTCNSYYDVVKGINYAYKGIKIKRTLVFYKPSTLIIFDEIKSEHEKEFLQIFNLGKHIDLLDVDNELIRFKSEEVDISIKQVLGGCSLKTFKGDRNVPRAVMSERFGQLIDIPQLEFSKKGKSVKFLTVIQMGDNTADVYFNDKNNLLEIKDGQVKLNIPL
ncbi:hypothetical protein CHI07_17165 [Paenibacillus sp. 7884-2]|nr:hypothetical protein CHI07_17165 [Paenibacillus sp. 7884-2]